MDATHPMSTSASSRYVASHKGQLSLLPSAELDMSQSAVKLCCWGEKAGIYGSFHRAINGGREETL